MPRINPKQLKRLITDHGPALTFYARQWTNWPDDVVQEAFVQLIRLEQAPDSAVAWLFGTVRRLALFAARTEKRRSKQEHQAARDSVVRHAVSMQDSWYTTVEGDQQEIEQMMDRLDDLPEEQREVVVARIWSGLSFEQIGQLIGVSSSSAHRRYLKALANLRSAMNNEQ